MNYRYGSTQWYYQQGHLFNYALKDAEWGKWRISHFTISEEAARMECLQMTMAGHGYRAPNAGDYVKISRNGRVIMSNTQAELRDMYGPIFGTAPPKGHILINGLGMGLLPWLLLQDPDVTKITIIELDREVIKLTGGQLFEGNPRVEIIEADAHEYQPPKGAFYDFVWNDIWDDISTDNKDSYSKLHRKYCRRCTRYASWAWPEVQRMKRREYADRRWGWF